MIEDLFATLLEKISDITWYGEGLAGLAFAGFIGGTIASFVSYLKSMRYRGWKAHVIEHAQTANMAEARQTLSLLPEEVRQILGSDLDGFRLIKSLVSTYCTITTANKKEALDTGWLRIKRHNFPLSLLGQGTIEIDLPQLPKDQLRGAKWNDGCEPRGWRDGNENRKNAQTFFVSGHEGAHEWAARQGIHASQIRHLTDDHISRIRPGDTVIGTLPINVIHRVQEKGGRYIHLSLDLPQDVREKARKPEGLTADEMDAYGARLQLFSLNYLGDWEH